MGTVVLRYFTLLYFILSILIAALIPFPLKLIVLLKVKYFTLKTLCYGILLSAH